MADKILSLESIKKCLEKVKNKIEKCIKMNYVNEIDFNTEFSPGFFNIPYRANTQNSPDGILFEYGTAVNICVPEKTGIAQLAFRRNEMTSFAARWGEVSGTTYNINSHPWLYFHGSTSPNIPVLKKKTVTGTTSTNGNLDLNLTVANAVVLSVVAFCQENKEGLICTLGSNENSVKYFTHITNPIPPFTDVTKASVTATVYYLEIPSGYDIPEDATATSDEPEDDEELALQSYTTYEKPSETKQFHGESLYE